MQLHIYITAMITSLFMKIVMGLKIEGYLNIPRRGGLIVAANHVSNWDPIVLGVSTALRRELFFLAKEELFLPNKFYTLLISKYNAIKLKRDGIDKKAIRISSTHLQRGRTIVIFPEGERNRHPEKGLLKPQPGVGYLALKTKSKIIPAYIHGTTERMMALLSRKKRISVRFGKLIDTSQFQQSASLLKRSIALSNYVMKEINFLSSYGKNNIS
jgi:1-acyl-sn-glycerol-3-phosphate acyltransferase